ncbi:zinc/manganese transport system ATP-binding protein [Corynebacterium mycetoides]|uniref:Zinc/manganese transport system ATP-binding protein n=1 Tax=Corynebacterium mycetoides TaxID=38302 RepID=A0A1G9P1K1_9CORY|nr:metal ABC transporter ATP-binding protein [Corynebacterium mycetoides]SDL92554.1 zinc/manganese transport system ATP-binding protein [Corynebacterium mycetoides]
MIARLTDLSAEPLWSGITLDIRSGEFIAVLGPNGSGKSTLLNIMLGLRRPTGGSVELPARVGYIPQQRMFPPHMPVRARDVVSLTLKHGTVRNRYPRRADVDAALERVGAGPLADARVGTLSGGHQQLVRQAQAFGNNPELVLADEPLLSLDASRQRETVRRLADSDAAVMMVTHTIDPVMPVVDKVLYLGPNGHVVGPAQEVLRTNVLSELYGTRVDVLTVRGKTVIV